MCVCVKLRLCHLNDPAMNNDQVTLNVVFERLSLGYTVADRSQALNLSPSTSFHLLK